MWLTKRRRRAAGAPGAGSTAPVPPSLEQLRAEIAQLAGAERTARDPLTERSLLWRRHLAGIRLLDEPPAVPRFPEPADPVTLPLGDPLPEFRREAVTPAVLRAAIVRDGCLLVRGLVPRPDAEGFAAEIEQAYARREQAEAGGGAADGYYEEFQPHERFGGVMWRAWIKEGGGLLAADSPRLCARMLELFEDAGVPALVSGYLGEPAVISVHKTTLRKAEPQVGGAWHQDGFFMGPVRAMNLWLALSRCGVDAPGLDLVPRRLDDYLATGTEGAELSWTISEQEVAAAAGEAGVVRPVFEPGDALFFDECFLHKTGSDPSMPRPRFAVENWFFGGSAFPPDYAPIAV